MTSSRSRVWTCTGETDEFHPFCPFATRHEERARAHDKLPGHHCVEEDVPGEWPLSGLQLDALRAEDEESA